MHITCTSSLTTGARPLDCKGYGCDWQPLAEQAQCMSCSLRTREHLKTWTWQRPGDIDRDDVVDCLELHIGPQRPLEASA